MEHGYVKTYRKILDNPVVNKDNDTFFIWQYILLSATHKEIETYFNGKIITLKPGQLIIGRKKLSEKCRVTEMKCYRYLKRLESEQLIEQQTSSKSTLITIVNWNKYQSNEQLIEQQMNNKRTTNEQQMNTIQECNNVINNKKEKINKKEKSFKKPTLEEVEKYCLERKNKIDIKQFINYYESNGWMVGRNKMKDWKATIRSWESRNKKNGPNWINKNIEKEEATDEEIKEMEELLKDFR